MTTTTARVLVVDDTPDVRDLLTMAIGRAPGFEVVGQAGDGGFGVVRPGAAPAVVVRPLGALGVAVGRRGLGSPVAAVVGLGVRAGRAGAGEEGEEGEEDADDMMDDDLVSAQR